ASPRHGLVAPRISASSFLKINAIALVAFGALGVGLSSGTIRSASARCFTAGGIANHELRHNHHVARGQVWFCLAFEHCVKGGDGWLIAWMSGCGGGRGAPVRRTHC